MATYVDITGIKNQVIDFVQTLSAGSTPRLVGTTPGYALVYVQGPSAGTTERMPYCAIGGDLVEFTSGGSLTIGGVAVTTTTFSHSSDRVKIVAFKNQP